MANNYNNDPMVVMLVAYRKCQHSTQANGYILDGCTQFVPTGPNGTPEAMLCAACHCHRSFHRRVVFELPQIHNDNARAPSPQPQIPPTVAPGHENTDSSPQPPARREEPSTRQAPSRSPPPQRQVHQERSHPPTAAVGREIMVSLLQPQACRDGASTSQAVPPHPSPLNPELMEARNINRCRNSITMTREQRESLTAIAESNNWKMFREYSGDEVNRICMDLGLTRMNLKNWINNHRPERVAARIARNARNAANLN